MAADNHSLCEAFLCSDINSQMLYIMSGTQCTEQLALGRGGWQHVWCDEKKQKI